MIEWGDRAGNPLTDIRAAMRLLDGIPPPAFFAQTQHFPAERALHFKHQGRDYVGAHPDFWRKYPEAAAPFPGSMWRIEIFDLDTNDKRRTEFFDAMGEAMGRARTFLGKQS